MRERPTPAENNVGEALHTVLGTHGKPSLTKDSQMGKENENYRGWSNYATWAFHMLLTYDAELFADWLKQVECIRKEWPRRGTSDTGH